MGRQRGARFYLVFVLLVALVCCCDGKLKRGRGKKHQSRKVEAGVQSEGQPSAADELFDDGLRSLQQGRMEEGAVKLERAAEQDPSHSKTIQVLSQVYRQTGKYEKLRTVYKRLLQLDDALLPPTQVVETSTSAGGKRKSTVKYKAGVYFNLGCVEQELGDDVQARQAFMASIKVDKTFADSYFRLGTTELSLGYANEALDTFEKGVKHDPTFAEIYVNMGNVYLERKEQEKAADALKKAVKYSPKMGEAYINLASALTGLDREKEAVRAARKGTELRPHMPEAFYNLGQSLELASDSTFKSALKGMNGFSHLPSSQFAALAAYTKALQLRPSYDEAFSSAFYIKDRISDWSTREDDFTRMKDIIFNGWKRGMKPVNPFRCFQYPLSIKELKVVSEAAARDETTKAERAASLLGQKWAQRPALSQIDSGRVRVGYLSADFGAFTVASLMQGVYGKQRGTTVELYCLSLNGGDGSAWRMRIEQDCEHFIDVSNDDDENIARRIRALNLHILIDLNGHSKGGRPAIFARKPAPILMNFLGYPSTLGGLVDYLVGDRVATPTDLAHGYSEKLVLLPHSYFVNSHRELYPASRSMRMHTDGGRMTDDFLKGVDTFDGDAARVPPLEVINQYRLQYGFPPRLEGNGSSDGEGIIFANLGQLYKVDNKLFYTWLDILRAVPKAVLWLLRFPKDAVINIEKVLKKEGMTGRVVFTDFLPVEDHISIKQMADIGLDTVGFNGHTTGADPLWAGVPMLTVPEEKMASRVGCSQAMALNIGEDTITHSIEEYKQRAVRLATNVEELRQLQHKLATSRAVSPFFDTSRWVKSFGRAMRMSADVASASTRFMHIVVADSERGPE